MLVRTILHRVHPIKGFVYENALWREKSGPLTLEVQLRPRRGGRAVCPGCGKKRPGYDTLARRRFEFVPFWGILVFLLYAPRRVDCPRCGVKVEEMPWAQGKSPVTKTYGWFLARWAKRLSWAETAEVFHTSWHTVWRSVKSAVEWGLAHRDLSGIQAIGIDEVQWKKGHHYLTLVYQIDAARRRLLWIGRDRTVRTLLRFFRQFGCERSAALRFVCSDMWKPYLKVIARKAGQALHVLDRFHIAMHMNKAIDEVRAEEARELKERGEAPSLKKSRWCLLKRPENLSVFQRGRLRDLLRLNLKTVRSYLLKEEFQFFWDYVSAYWAGRFLDGWVGRVMRSRLEPMKQVARMLRGHRPLLLNWFRARKAISNGVVEGLNLKAKLTMRKAYGFSEYSFVELALYHTMADLPEPETAHKFF